MARLGFEGNDDNNTTLHRLQYQLPLAPTTKVFVEAVGSEFNDNYYTFNPELQLRAHSGAAWVPWQLWMNQPLVYAGCGIELRDSPGGAVE